MPSTRDIRRRIKSVKSTAQIAKAMQMVASAKMRRAQLSALASRPYARLMYRIQRDVTTHAGDFTHPILEAREVRRRAVILVSTDKGMCGALNSNLFREAAQYVKQTTVFIAAGRKAAQFVWILRKRLSETGMTVPNQLKKPSQKPTTRWVFQIFMGVTHTVLIEDGSVVKTIVHLTQEQVTILKLLGPECEKYYGLQG